MQADNRNNAMSVVRRSVPVAKLSAAFLAPTSAGVMSIYAVDPVVRVSYDVRGAILLIWFWNVCTFAVSGGMLLWAWLVDRFGDRS